MEVLELSQRNDLKAMSEGDENINDGFSNTISFDSLLKSLENDTDLNKFRLINSINYSSDDNESESSFESCESDECIRYPNELKEVDFATHGLKGNKRRTAYFNRNYEPEHHYLKYFSRGLNFTKRSFEVVDHETHIDDNGDDIIEHSIISETSNEVYENKEDYCENFSESSGTDESSHHSAHSDYEEENQENEEVDCEVHNEDITDKNVNQSLIDIVSDKDNEDIGVASGSIEKQMNPPNIEDDSQTVSSCMIPDELPFEETKTPSSRSFDNSTENMEMLEMPPQTEDTQNASDEPCSAKESASNSREEIVHMASSIMMETTKHLSSRIQKYINDKTDGISSYRTPSQKKERALKDNKSDFIKVSSSNISKNRSYLVVGTTDGMIHLWAFGKRKYTFEGTPINELYCQDPLVWKPLSSEPNISIKAHATDIVSIHVNPVHKNESKISCIIATAGQDCYIKLWGFYKRESRMDIISECLLEYVPVSVSLVPGGSGRMMVATQIGIVELWKLSALENIYKSSSAGMELTMEVERSIDTGKIITYASISEKGRYYAVGSSKGFLMLYNRAMDLIGVFECKNRRGYYSSGREITGIRWNSGETMMLVTTSDSRIRLFATNSDENGTLLYLEKFKGHKNKICKLSAQFFGSEDECILCPSESGHICIWLHNQFYEDSTDFSSKPYKTRCSERIRLPSLTQLSSIGLYNVEQWAHIMPTILEKEKRSKSKEVEPDTCLWDCKNFDKGIDAKDSDPRSDILLVSIENGQKLKYSILSLQCFEFAE